MNRLFEMLEKEITFYEEMLQAYLIDISRYKRVYLLGAGKGGKMVAESLRGIWESVDFCFVDSDVSIINVEVYEGIRGVGWNMIKEDSDSIAILTSIKNTKEILQLCDKRIRIDVDYVRLLTQYQYSWDTLRHKTDYLKVCDMLSDNESKRIFKRVLQNRVSGLENLTYDIYSRQQYFREEFRELFGKNEVLLDCGAYIGDSIDIFMEYMKSDGYNCIYAFEMDSDNYEILRSNFHGKDDNIHLFNYGVGNKNETVWYTRNLESSSYVRDVIQDNAVQGEVVNYDSFSENNPEIECDPTIIKMDIEGAEMDALFGMEKTILRSRPKLFISIYHLQDDLWRIPLYIQSILPEYSFYIRHHTAFHADTVLYGFDKRGK